MDPLLNTLKRMADGISKTFGQDCEVVIHDMEKEVSHSVVYIVNGHVSNRDINDSASYIVLNVKKNPEVKYKDRFNYIINSDNKYLKCTSMFFYNKDVLRYIFSINFDITSLLKTQEAVSNLITHEESDEFDKFPTDVNQMLERLLQQSVDLVGKPVAEMNYKDKAKAIKFLDDCGAFLITKATDVVADFYGISKYTIYNHTK